MRSPAAESEPEDDADWASPQIERVRATIGARLRSHRIHLNLTGVALAKAAGISGAMLSKIEAAERMPSVPVLAALASALNIEIGDLFGGMGVMDEPRLLRAGEVIEQRTHPDDRRLVVHQLGVIELPEVQVRLLVMNAAKGAGPTKPIQFDGFWIDHVLTGEIVMCIGGRDYALKAGDTLSYRGEVPHFAKAFPSGPTTVLAVQGWINSSATNRVKLDGALLSPGQR